MKLLQKIILGYIIFGILAFITVAVFTSHQNETYLREHTAASLKKEAGLIASDYGSSNYTSQFQLNNLQERLSGISDYLEGDIYVIDPSKCIDCGTCASVCPSEAIAPAE